MLAALAVEETRAAIPIYQVTLPCMGGARRAASMLNGNARAVPSAARFLMYCASIGPAFGLIYELRFDLDRCSLDLRSPGLERQIIYLRFQLLVSRWSTPSVGVLATGRPIVD